MAHRSCILLLIFGASNLIVGNHAKLNMSPISRQDCSGSSDGLNGLSVSSSQIVKRLSAMYANCTVVNGNLELVKIRQEMLIQAGVTRLDFLDNIEEVTGYVIIAQNSLNELSLKSLKIVWGDVLFTPAHDGSTERSRIITRKRLGLFVFGNHITNFDMRSLRSIEKGEVVVHLNPHLCFWQMLDWDQLVDNSKRLTIEQNYENCTAVSKCHPDCDGHCWGPAEDQCQIIYRRNCAPQCATQMCFKAERNPLFCCSPDCAGGCTGPRSEDCVGCKMFRNQGQCVSHCPPPMIYNPEKKIKVYNPEGTYHYSHDCVKECPEHMLIEEDSCVSRCKEGYTIKDDSNRRTCVPCDGPCPKSCVLETTLDSSNIVNYVNCTRIDGFIELLTDVMEDRRVLTEGNTNSTEKRRGLTYSGLEALSSVRTVTKYIVIQTHSDKFSNLDFLRNLETIEGRSLFERRFALQITNTLMDHLGLLNLRRIMKGQVLISDNPNLCYSHRIPWKEFAPDGAIIVKNSFRGENVCERIDNFVCDYSCDSNRGCWGSGPSMCFSCKYWTLEETRICIPNCLDENNRYVSNATAQLCSQCDSECNACHGPGPYNCKECKHVIDDHRCIFSCPVGKYADEFSVCQPCNSACDAVEGCSGPGDFLGEGGCNRCFNALINNNRIERCLPETTVNVSGQCHIDAGNYFAELPKEPSHVRDVKRSICKKCHDACKYCFAYGTETDLKHHSCVCSHYIIFNEVNSSTCVLSCPDNFFSEPSSDPNYPGQCHACSDRCGSLGCYGTNSSQCNNCKEFSYYHDPNNETAFRCVDKCPPEAVNSDTDRRCSEYDSTALKQQTMVSVGIALGVVFAIICVCGALLFVKYRRKWNILSSMINGTDIEFDKINPNPKAMPNLATLRLLKENELRRGDMLGCGAFGVVFKGIWMPPDEASHGKKFPVAIKVLNESDKENAATAKSEMLDEAAHMASMNHRHLVRLIGVCMGQEMMLITPLMPLGNLLEFVQNNKSRINSLTFLIWCKQISEGMAHLESNRLVHRDLAARNVLVQNIHHVRITDFGLAKMIDFGEDEYCAAGGKMPIKWLAMECIRYRRFTHKSDVWACGVTFWELFTYGEKPYKETNIKDVPDLLEKGERLPQPSICTLDVYMLLIKCWMVDADSRPSFRELNENFSRWAMDPARYLVIPSDGLLRIPLVSVDEQRRRLGAAVDIDASDLIDEELYYGDQSVPLSPSTPTKPLMHGDSIERSSGTFLLNHHSHRTPSTGSSRYGPEPCKIYGIGGHVRYSPDDNYLKPDRGISSNSSRQNSVFDHLSTTYAATPGVSYTDVVSSDLTDASGRIKYVPDAVNPYYNDLQMPTDKWQSVTSLDPVDGLYCVSLAVPSQNSSNIRNGPTVLTFPSHSLPPLFPDSCPSSSLQCNGRTKLGQEPCFNAEVLETETVV